MQRSLRIAAAILGVVFVLEGLLKFTPGMAEQFAQWGYAAWFATVIGVVQIAVGVLLFVPRAVGYAALVLAVLMLGAVVTVVRGGDYLYSFVPVLLFVYASVVSYVALR